MAINLIFTLSVAKFLLRSISLFQSQKLLTGTQNSGKLLYGHPGVRALLSDRKPPLTGALKVEPTTMIRMSALGCAVKTEVTIQSPWGGQTKPAGQDAFLVFDDTQKQYYLVNVDDKGLPIGYLPVR